MRLAITTFGKRISPRFDCAKYLLIVDMNKGEIVKRKEEPVDGMAGGRRVSFLVERGVQVILTGGILRCDYFAALNAGLEVHAGFMGEVEEILKRYLSGTLPRFGPGLDLSRGHRKKSGAGFNKHKKGLSSHARRRQRYSARN